MNCAKETVKLNFSRRASSYDRHSYAQTRAALRLMDMTPDAAEVSSVLEIGCGTGSLTSMLAGKYPGARLSAMDISSTMLKKAYDRCCRGTVDFMNADIERFSSGKRFDLVASNAALHWSEKLDLSARRIYSSLVPGGILCASLYGPGTFRELSLALSVVSGREVSLPAHGFCEKSSIGNIFGKYFTEVVAHENDIELVYPRLVELLKDIHLSGSRGHGAGEGRVLGPGVLRRTEDVYREKFGVIKSTHNIIYIKARRRK